MSENTGIQAGNPSSEKSKRWWVIAAIIVLLLVVGLAWSLWPLWSADKVRADDSAQLQVLLEKNKILRNELQAIAPPEGPICKPGEILRAVPESTAANPSTDSHPPAGQASARSGPTVSALSTQELALKLELATALVVVVGNGGLATGTGFFISPSLLVTNQHVVEGAISNRLLLTSKSLKAVRRGTVLKASGTTQTGSADFALVRMDDGVAPGILNISPNVSKLAAVVAAGYPAVVVQNDPSFRRLVEGGDANAAPDLSIVRGEIQSLQNSAQGVSQLVHTAPISGGNSGGPLVDACGRVIGVNTFIAVDQKQSARVSYAIGAKAMAEFLVAAGTSANSDSRTCK